MVAPIFAETSVLSNNQATIKGQQKPNEFQETMANHEKTFFFHKTWAILEPMPPDVQDMYRFDLCTKQPGWPGGGRGSGSSPHRFAIRGMITLW